jgi:hypothetical protein
MSRGKEILIREVHRLACEAGFAGFMSKFFEDPDAVREWPDIASREQALRAAWKELAAEHLPGFARRHAATGIESLAALIAMLHAERGRTPQENEVDGRQM